MTTLLRLFPKLGDIEDEVGAFLGILLGIFIGFYYKEPFAMPVLVASVGFVLLLYRFQARKWPFDSLSLVFLDTGAVAIDALLHNLKATEGNAWFTMYDLQFYCRKHDLKTVRDVASDGLVLILDSNDESRLKESVASLHALLSDQHLATTPIIILANRTDQLDTTAENEALINVGKILGLDARYEPNAEQTERAQAIQFYLLEPQKFETDEGVEEISYATPSGYERQDGEVYPCFSYEVTSLILSYCHETVPYVFANGQDFPLRRAGCKLFLCRIAKQIGYHEAFRWLKKQVTETTDFVPFVKTNTHRDRPREPLTVIRNQDLKI